MPDLTSTDISADALVRDAVKLAREYMQPYIDLCVEARDAYSAKGYVDDPEAISVKINHLLDVVEHNVPRDAQALWPTRPFIPLKAKAKGFEKWAMNKAKVIDAQMDRGKFFTAGTSCLRIAEMDGTAFLEPYWDVWIENIEDVEVVRDPMTGQIIQIDKQQASEVRDGLAFRARGLWEVLLHPLGVTMRDKPWVILKDVVTVQEVMRHLDDPSESGWKLPDNISIDDLKSGPSLNHGNDEWQGLWHADLSRVAGRLHGEIGVLHRLFSESRELVVWNYDVVLSDTENKNTNMDRRTKPVVAMRMNTHVDPNRFYGRGLWETIRDIDTIDNDIISLFMNNQLAATARWFLYDDEYVDPEQLVAGMGRRIRIKHDASLDNFDKAVRVLDVPPLDDRLFDLHGLFLETKDNRTKQRDIARGEGPFPKTKGGTEAVQAEAQIPNSFQVRFLENDFMPELAHLVCKLAGRNMTLVQMMDDGGLSFDEAIEIMDPDPENIPGGFSYEFEGSERVGRREQKYQKLIEAYNMTANNQAVAMGPLAIEAIRKIWEGTEVFDKTELEMWLPSMAQQQGMAPMAPGMPPGAMPPMMPQETAGETQAMMPPNQIETGDRNAQMQQEAVTA